MKTIILRGAASPRAGRVMPFVRLSRILAVCATMLGSAAFAQDGTTSFIVGYAPGGGNDLTARILAEKLSQTMGHPVIVENKPGASGRLAAEMVSKATPDGKTLLATGNSVVSMAAVIYKDLNYDPVQDLVPIAILAEYPQLVLIVKADHPAKTFAELVEWSTANPDSSNYAAVAPAYTIPTEQLKLESGLQAQPVSYKSSSEALVAVLNGQVTFLLGDHNTTLPNVEDGGVRALLVTGEDSITELPEVPSAGQLGYNGVDSSLWTGLFAPKGTPPELAAELAAAVNTALQDPTVIEKLKDVGVTPGDTSTDDFAARIQDEIKSIRAVVDAANLTFE